MFVEQIQGSKFLFSGSGIFPGGYHLSNLKFDPFLPRIIVHQFKFKILKIIVFRLDFVLSVPTEKLFTVVLPRDLKPCKLAIYRSLVKREIGCARPRHAQPFPRGMSKKNTEWN